MPEMTNEELVTALIEGQLRLQQMVLELAKTLKVRAELEDRRSEQSEQSH